MGPELGFVEEPFVTGRADPWRAKNPAMMANKERVKRPNFIMTSELSTDLI